MPIRRFAIYSCAIAAVLGTLIFAIRLGDASLSSGSYLRYGGAWIATVLGLLFWIWIPKIVILISQGTFPFPHNRSDTIGFSLSAAITLLVVWLS